MTTSLETANPKALDALTEALREVAAYRQNPANRGRLDVASVKIRSALKEDPNYLRALYYDAMVDDLSGRPREAPPKYERILSVADPGSAFSLEVRYNLGVAYYHRYSWPYLDKAIAEFTDVIEQANDPSLRLLARAGRAQAYAMHLIPPAPDKYVPGPLVDMARSCKNDIEAALMRPSLRMRLFRRGPGSGARELAEWAAHNAAGMRKMYLSDYWEQLDADQRARSGEEPEQSVEALLLGALTELTIAEGKRERDWANWCDMASAHWRLARLSKDPAMSDELFSQAVAKLEEVIQVLRPGYGFALYEIGRVYRTWGRFANAIAYLERAKAIPVADRDVGDTRVDLEVARANAGSREYP